MTPTKEDLQRRVEPRSADDDGTKRGSQRSGSDSIQEFPTTSGTGVTMVENEIRTKEGTANVASEDNKSSMAPPGPSRLLPAPDALLPPLKEDRSAHNSESGLVSGFTGTRTPVRLVTGSGGSTDMRLKRARKKNGADDSGPSYYTLVKEAILHLKERNGSSKEAIEKYVRSKKKASFALHYLNNVLKSGVKNGRLIQSKGSFRLSAAEKKEHRQKLAREKKEFVKENKLARPSGKSRAPGGETRTISIGAIQRPSQKASAPSSESECSPPAKKARPTPNHSSR